MTAPPPYQVLAGSLVRFVITFTDYTGAPMDPTFVSCVVGIPGSPGIILQPGRDGIGLYHADWNTTGVASGVYYCLANGSGAMVAVNEVAVRVVESEIS
jgi:hypothetical protein